MKKAGDGPFCSPLVQIGLNIINNFKHKVKTILIMSHSAHCDFVVVTLKDVLLIADSC